MGERLPLKAGELLRQSREWATEASVAIGGVPAFLQRGVQWYAHSSIFSLTPFFRPDVLKQFTTISELLAKLNARASPDTVLKHHVVHPKDLTPGQPRLGTDTAKARMLSRLQLVVSIYKCYL